jgi:type 1 fimbria pilin
MLLLLLSQSVLIPASSASETDFTATILGGNTCTISLDKDSQELSDFGDFMPNDAYGKDYLELKPLFFDLQLIKCQGLEESGKVPKILVTGEPLKDKDGKVVDDLFSDSGNKTGFGVLLGMLTDPHSNDASKEIKIKPGEALPIYSKEGQEMKVINEDMTIRFHAGLSCGSKEDCVPERIQFGNINTVITFDFQYQ